MFVPADTGPSRHVMCNICATSRRFAVGADRLSGRWSGLPTMMVVTVTIEFPAEAQARLEKEAICCGITLDQLIAELAAALRAENADEPRGKLSFVGIGSSTSGRSARDANEMLAEGLGRG